jgi:hypothetical protein
MQSIDYKTLIRIKKCGGSKIHFASDVFRETFSTLLIISTIFHTFLL